MAEKYIINLPEKTEVDDNDIVIVEDAEDTKRMKIADFFNPIKDTINNVVGSLLSLETTNKTSVVGAINENFDKNNELGTKIAAAEGRIEDIETNNSFLNLGLIDDPLSEAREMSSQTSAIAFSNGAYNFGDRSTYAAFQLYRRWSMSFVVAYRLDGKISYARHDGDSWLTDSTGTWSHK